jgi:fatty acid kinase fatty acid binding subunit
MSEVAICTDSSALFPTGFAERLQVVFVPVSVTVDGSAYDERALPLDDFYERLSRGAHVTTSLPSPGEFMDAYANAAARGTREVVSIHLDARLSGTLASAELAARESPIRVTVVEATTASFGVGLCVRAAAAAVAAGASAAEAAEAAEAQSGTLRNLFVAHSGPQGRLPRTDGWTLLELADGKIEARSASTGLPGAIDAIVGEVFRDEGPLRAAVGHAGAATEAEADALALALDGLADVVEVERYRVGAAVGAHTGALSFGAFWWDAE